MLFLYNTSLLFVRGLFNIASLFHGKAKLFVTGRKNIFQKIKDSLKSNPSPLIWIHCASLGEFEQGRPIIEALKKEFPMHKIFLTFFSPSGFEIRKNYPSSDYVFYLPWDTKKNARRFVEITKPSLAIFVKYEFWLHYSNELKRRNIPILSVSSIFRPHQYFFRSYGGFYRSILKNFSYFFVQNDESVKLLHSIGIKNCSQVGDTRFDRVAQILKQPGEIEVAKKFKNNQPTFVVGSCWREDLDVLAPFINENKIKFIIAPHEISESFLAEIEKSLMVKSIRYSLAEQVQSEDYQVLLIDNVGMLSKLYRYGEFAFIGGAFGKGLHNILEAACYGVPIFFGNKSYERFQEAVDLINRGGAFDVSDYSDLKAKFEILNVPESFQLACEVTRLYVEENLGATEKIMKYCRNLLKV
jgi:3-deoxy-D-manno-octulosonic-acid transferase